MPAYTPPDKTTYPQLPILGRSAIRKAAPPYLLVVPVFVILAATVFYPIAYAFYISMFDFNLLNDDTPTRLIFLQNYVDILGDARFWNSVRATAILTFFCVLLEFGLGFGMALLVSEKLPARRLIRTLLMAPVLMTPIAVAIVFRLMWHEEFGVLNWVFESLGIDYSWTGSPIPAFFIIIVAEVWQNTSFVFIVLLGGMQMLPSEPYEAASIDGAGYWQKVWHLTIPLLAPAILVALLFRIVFSIRMFEKPFVLTEGGPNNATEAISLLIRNEAFIYYEIGRSSAMSVILTLMTVLMAFILVRVMYRKEFS